MAGAVVDDDTFKYSVGSRLLLRLGDRPIMAVTVIEQVNRSQPHYKIDWTEHGFNVLLNDVPIPEKSFLGLAGSES